MQSGIVTVDLHGKNTYQAKVTLDALLRRGHNYTQIRQALRLLDAEELLEDQQWH